MAFNDILKLRVHCRMHGGEVLNVLHFVDEAGFAGDVAQTLANDFRDNLGAALRGRACAELAFEFIEVIRIVPYGDGPRIATWASGTVGTVPGASLTATLAEVVTVHSSEIGRRKRGRMYLAGAPGTAMSGGNWTNVQTIRTQTLATALMARYGPTGSPGGFHLGIWSKLTAGPDPPWPTDAFVRATALTVRTTIRNQRRRQLGVGR